MYSQDQIEKETGVRFVVQDNRKSPEFHKSFPAAIEAKLRPYQKDCVGVMEKASNCGGIVRSATGTGKTYQAGAYFSILKGNGCFVVDELTLLEQAVRELQKTLGEPIGVIGDQVFDPKRITVATIQTLHRHRKDLKFTRWSSRLAVVIVDEVHVALNRRNVDVINDIQPLAVFGLTATLELKKADVRLRAIALTGPPIFEYDLKTGVEQGFLSQGAICRVQVKAEGLFPSYHDEYKHLISHNKRRNDCVEALCREGLKRGKRVIVLVERLAHLRILSQRLEDLPHAVLCGAIPKMERFNAKTSMDAGEMSLILATRVFSKGVDIRTVDVIIDATAGKSHNSAVQRYGRGVRMAKGKAGLLYFDIADASASKNAVKNRFATSARSRLKALKALGSPITTKVWGIDSPEQMYPALEKSLLSANKKAPK